MTRARWPNRGEFLSIKAVELLPEPKITLDRPIPGEDLAGQESELVALEKMEARIEYDLAYLRNWSLRLDLQIIVRTALGVVRGDGNAY